MNTEIIKNENEIEDIYRRYAAIVFRRCKSILRSDDKAWDATQEVFLKLMKSMPKIKNTDSILCWLHRTTTNHCISFLRKEKRLLHTSDFEEYYAKGLGPEKTMLLKEILHTVFRPWKKHVREIVLYALWDGYTQDEIASLTGLGTSTIRKYLTQFRRNAQTQRNLQSGAADEL